MRQTANKRNALNQVWEAVLCGYNACFIALEEEGVGSELKVGFLSGDRSPALNGLFTGPFLRGMQEGKDYCMLNPVFFFVTGFIDLSPWFAKQASKTMLENMYYYLVSFLMEYRGSKMTDIVWNGELKRSIKKFRLLLKPIWIKMWDWAEFANVHQLDYVFDDIKRVTTRRFWIHRSLCDLRCKWLECRVSHFSRGISGIMQAFGCLDTKEEEGSETCCRHTQCLNLFWHFKKYM